MPYSIAFLCKWTLVVVSFTNREHPRRSQESASELADEIWSIPWLACDCQPNCALAHLFIYQHVYLYLFTSTSSAFICVLAPFSELFNIINNVFRIALVCRWDRKCVRQQNKYKFQQKMQSWMHFCTNASLEVASLFESVWFTFLYDLPHVLEKEWLVFGDILRKFVRV